MVRAHGRLMACPQRTDFSHWPRRKPDREQLGDDTSKYPSTAQSLSRACSQDFLRGGAIQRGDGPNDTSGATPGDGGN